MRGNSDWIRRCFKKYKYDISRVMECYEKYKKETGAEISLDSYKVRVFKIANEFGDKVVRKEKKIDWVKDQLAENGYNIAKVTNMFGEYQKRFGTDCNEISYRTMVLKAAKLSGKNVDKLLAQEKMDGEESLTKYSTSQLIDILYDETKKKGSRLTLPEIIHIAYDRNTTLEKFEIATHNQLPKFLNNISKELFKSGDETVKAEQYRMELSKLKKEHRELIEKKTAENKITETLEKALLKFKPLDSKINIVKHPITNRTAVLMLTDFHFDETVDIENMMGINKYNPTIAAMRLKSIIEQAIANMKELSMNKMVIFLGGDMIAGNIHAELSETAMLGVTESVLQLYDLLAHYLYKLSQIFEVRIVCLVGNHGRTTQKKEFKNVSLKNYEHILYGVLKRSLDEVVKEFRMPNRAFDIMDIQGYNFYFTHGDNFKGGTGFSPVSNLISRDVSKIAGLFRQKELDNPIEIDYICMGHFHIGVSTMSFDNKEIIINGSLVGANEFSINKIHRGVEASQTFMAVEKGKGVRFRDLLKVGHIK